MPSHRLALLHAVLPLLLVTLAGCDRSRPLFRLLDPERTGVTFANTITTDDSLNVQTDSYVYNGAGVAVGDVDNDGLPDIYLAGNMVSSRLYRNKGEMRFEDVTERAGVGTARWATGVAMADVNGDGFLDVYVSVSGPAWSTPAQRANLLFVNDGDGTFTEAAARYGVADSGFTTHAAFLDYDGDGCLDLFLLNNSPSDFTRGGAAHPSGKAGETPDSYNQLYRHDCRRAGGGTFANVSAQAGILRTPGYGLGVVATDIDGDGRTDIYVSNDIAPNDVLYVNNGDGTFTDKAARWLKHASFAGMGVDVADFDDDGRPDILQVDMLPRDLERRKRTGGFLTPATMSERRSQGYRDDYSVNVLQLSNGVTPEGDLVFSDVAPMAGVAATGWSWSALLADFDNDGRKDAFITNGYPKGVTDLDYVAAVSAAQRGGSRGPRRSATEVLRQLPGYEEPNHVFRNRGDLTFADETRAWGLERPSFSYGAAYADLDNDGRLDLVVNNIDAPAFIYHNVGAGGGAERHWLQVRLRGATPHQRGDGARLVLTAGGRKQYVQHTPYRGYMSTVDDRVHFGLGDALRADTLEVTWPDGRRQVLTNVAADRILVVRHADATPAPPAAPAAAAAGAGWFQPLGAAAGLAHAHRVGSLVDYGVQPLLPYMVSRQGPALAVGDADGDGLDDLFVGGGGGAPGRLFLQQQGGRFAAAPGGSAQPWAADSASETWGALFFDANGDGRQDLYVASGGYHVAPSSPLLRDRLYVNQGGGRFARDDAALPEMLGATAAVRAGDYDGDGRLDLFVGGRLTPRAWPLPARSWVLRNEGGRFVDVTERVAPELARPGGMVTDAAWVDLDGDRRLDLVTVGEWMPVQFWRNERAGDGARLRDASKDAGLPPTRGWWYALAAGDFDRDGRVDLVAGNLGLNTLFATGEGRRFGVYAADLTGNRTTDVVLTQEVDGTEYPYAGLAQLGRAIYTVGLRFPTVASFARATAREALGEEALARATHYQADTFASVFLRNEGGGRFAMRALPNLAQIAPARGLLAHDVDGDGHLDLLLAGNLYDTEPNTPRADAGNGLWLRGDGKGGLAPVPPARSGFLAPKHVAGLALVRGQAGVVVVVANVGDSLQAYAVRSRR